MIDVESHHVSTVLTASRCDSMRGKSVWYDKIRDREREKKNLQNCEMGASSWGAVPPLELSFWTCVGGTGLCDWPVARYIACTQRILSCSSSLAKITVSPSFRALKNVRPPSSPEWKEEMLLGFLFTGTFGDDMNPALMMLLHRHLFSCKQTLLQPF